MGLLIVVPTSQSSSALQSILTSVSQMFHHFTAVVHSHSSHHSFADIETTVVGEKKSDKCIDVQ